MAKSAAFARIKDQVLTMTCHIPAGRVCTYQALGEHLDVMPRHVAYLLATLAEPDRQAVPWHRVVGQAGTISSASSARAQQQRQRLQAEGIGFSDAKTIADFATVFIAAADLNSGIAPQTRPPNPALQSGPPEGPPEGPPSRPAE